MLRARLATAAVAIPLLLVMIWTAPTWVFVWFVALIGVLGLAEYAAMAFPTRRAERLLVIAGGGAAIVAGCAGSPAAMVGALSATIIIGLTWVLLGRSDFEAGLRDLGLAAVGIAYLGLLVPHFAFLQTFEPDGRGLVLLVIAVGMAGDTSGYFAGRYLGRHKLIPRVSPGKTIEGAIGIMAGSVLGAALAGWLFLPDWPWQRLLPLALLMGVIGQIGDLTESVMKRTFGTKESGWLFPGHGGVLDRVDSLLFPVVVVYYHVSIGL